jgi:hypothetical protein
MPLGVLITINYVTTLKVYVPGSAIDQESSDGELWCGLGSGEVRDLLSRHNFTAPSCYLDSRLLLHLKPSMRAIQRYVSRVFASLTVITTVYCGATLD